MDSLRRGAGLRAASEGSSPSRGRQPEIFISYIRLLLYFKTTLVPRITCMHVPSRRSLEFEGWASKASRTLSQRIRGRLELARASGIAKIRAETAKFEPIENSIFKKTEDFKILPYPPRGRTARLVEAPTFESNLRCQLIVFRVSRPHRSNFHVKLRRIQLC